MSDDNLLETIFAGELKELMVVSYIVLGNNAVTNRFIERRFRMPVQAWSALYAIERFPGLRAKEIRQLFPRPQNTISRAVALLEKRKLIVQEASDSDGREKRLFATDEGRKLLVEMIDVSRRRQDEWLAPLSPEERSTFFDLARKIASGPRLLSSTVML
ncbi:MAG: MarR family transcriptional regulator [Rhizobiaceae bacterium]|nr:MarR family transcriptional regulator [Rhizobiaceae bacterium]